MPGSGTSWAGGVPPSTSDWALILMSMFWGMSQTGVWDGSQRGVNLLDTGSHFYDAYECADGKWLSVGAITRFFTSL